MNVSLIAALTRAGVIGAGNTLPWRLPADLKRFKSMTLGHSLILGRKTYESIGRPLPGRRIVIVTRNPAYRRPGALIAASLERALALCAGEQEAFIGGGAELFAAALPLAQRMYLTWVEAEVPGDAFMPEVDWSEWQETHSESLAADADNPYATTFAVYERRPMDGTSPSFAGAN